MRIRRFDADRDDSELTWAQALRARPTARQLLWLDIAGALEPDETEQLSKLIELARSTRRELERAAERPHLELHGAYFHVRIATEPDPARPDDVRWLDIVAARNVIISRHAEPIAFLNEITDRIQADATIGLLDSAAFVATLLDAALTTYLAAVDSIEDEVDRLDAKSLGRDPRPDVLNELVALRRRVARLRRTLADQRSVFASLATPEFAQASAPDHANAFQGVSTRFAAALAAVEDLRELLLGSFEVYMTRTAQRTNEVMKVLALATVLLLPGTLIAGLLGMNVTVPISKDDPMSFWYAVIGIAALALVVVVVARARRWL